MPIVSATGSMSGSAGYGGPAKANPVEEAMIAAIKTAQEEGITDPEIIRQRVALAVRLVTNA